MFETAYLGRKRWAQLNNRFFDWTRQITRQVRSLRPLMLKANSTTRAVDVRPDDKAMSSAGSYPLRCGPHLVIERRQRQSVLVLSIRIVNRSTRLLQLSLAQLHNGAQSKLIPRLC